MRTLLLALGILCSTPLTMEGQAVDSLRLKPGDLVRLSGPLSTDRAWVTGRVVEVRPHEFTFSMEGAIGGTYSREFLSIDTIEVAYRNARESARGGAVLGGFAGVGLGMVAGVLLARHVSMDTGPALAVSGVAGGVLGALTGGLAGARISPLRWRRYVFQDRPTAGPRSPCAAPPCDQELRLLGSNPQEARPAHTSLSVENVRIP